MTTYPLPFGLFVARHAVAFVDAAIAGLAVFAPDERPQETGLALHQPDAGARSHGQWLARRRHIPPVLALLALTVMLVATARPTARITMPTQQQTILLAVDVSGSMRATDVAPNRLVAAAQKRCEGIPAGFATRRKGRHCHVCRQRSSGPGSHHGP